VYTGPKYEKFYLSTSNSMLYAKCQTYILYYGNFRSKVCFNKCFEENEFNLTVLWLKVTLLSISRSPLFCFAFRL
jgi:hypothetical protein